MNIHPSQTPNKYNKKSGTGSNQASHSDDTVALAEDCSHGSAHLPSAAPGAALYPWELTSSLPLSKGGVGLVHVPTQIQALHAKVISRLPEPEKLAWKVFQLYHLSQVSQIQPLGQHPVQQRDRPVANASPARTFGRRKTSSGQGLLQPATSAATKHSNLSVGNQALAAMYEHPALHDHVADWAPVRSGQHNAEPRPYYAPSEAEPPDKPSTNKGLQLGFLK
ncbi:TPA: hypothetical protein ACH3X3_010767 [Trebouxia sp. C0006]